MVEVGLALSSIQGRSDNASFGPPSGLGWNTALTDVTATQTGGGYAVNVNPRGLVDPAIWAGQAYHVDGVAGNDSSSGIGAFDGDFSTAKKSIHSAFSAGNASGNPYRVLVKAGNFEGSAFTKNGQVEPSQPVAIMGWGGAVRYRTGPNELIWVDAGGTYTCGISSLNRLFRTDALTSNGLYTELTLAPDIASCQSTVDTWFKSGSTVHINIGRAPGLHDIAAMRNFNGARFMSHTDDLYLEDIHCEGGITGALHCDPQADRNVVGVNCSFRYSSPSNVNSPLDAVKVRRTNGLVAFFDCDASGGAKDGWSFHDDGYGEMNVLMSNCTGFENGAFSATSCNGFTAHDAVVSAVVGGSYGYSRNGAEVHLIQNARAWFLGTTAIARDPDGSCVGFKCSNATKMWLENTQADAAGGAVSNLAIEANGGSVFVRDHVTISGVNSAYGGGSITAY
ncbi:MAG: hypothetical protein ABJI96_12140 [Paracoccaceae bacterium]